MEALVAAIWGFCGAVPYAGTRLVTALWAGSETTPRQRALALGQFAISLFTGPVAAAALAPWLADYTSGWGPAPPSLEGIATLVGLLSNSAWPIMTDKSVVAQALSGVGGWLTKLGAKVKGDEAGAD